MICPTIVYSEDWQPLADIIIPNFETYCKRHDYFYTWYPVGENYHFGYDTLETHYEWMQEGWIGVIMDCDMLITNHNCKFEDYIDCDHDFFICNDIHGINAGIYFIRKTEWSNKFVSFILSKRNELQCEQDAINEWIKQYGTDKIKILPQSAFNAYKYELYPEFGKQTEENGEWIEAKSFILHLPGVSMDTRLKTITETKEQIIYE